MTKKKYRQKEFKRLRSLGWPYYAANLQSRHPFEFGRIGFVNLDDLDCGRISLYSESRNLVVYIDRATEEWTQHHVVLNLSNYYD